MRAPETFIPDGWRKAVASLLRRGAVSITLRARLDFEALFPDSWDYERNEAIAAALETDGITGRKILDMRGFTETWEFFFVFRGRKLYGKVGVVGDVESVSIISAHQPLKGESL